MVERIGLTKGVNTHTYGYRKCFIYRCLMVLIKTVFKNHAHNLHTDKEKQNGKIRSQST